MSKVTTSGAGAEKILLVFTFLMCLSLVAELLTMMTFLSLLFPHTLLILRENVFCLVSLITAPA